MRRMAEYSPEENLEDARRVARMFHKLANFPRPTLAIVHGNAFGGGVGLIAMPEAYSKPSGPTTCGRVRTNQPASAARRRPREAPWIIRLSS